MNQLFWLIMGFFINMTYRSFHFTLSLVRNGIYMFRNKVSRGVSQPWRRMDETMLLGAVDPQCSVLITGGAAYTSMRDRLLTQLARQTQQSCTPVVILHRGNANLVQRIATLPNAIICGRKEHNYDPFRDLDAGTIADVLLDNLPTSNPYALNIPQAKTYIRGLAQFYIRCRGKRPSLNALCDCTDVSRKGYMSILSALRNAQSQNRIAQSEYNGIKSLLDAGQSQEVILHAFLLDILHQLSSCVPPLRTSLIDGAFISIRRAIVRNAILCIDVSSVTNEALFYHLFVNELIRSEADLVGRPYLILDDINIKSSPVLTSFLESGVASAHCICCKNVYAAINDGKAGTPLFNSLASGCDLHITLKQPSGAAAGLWSDYYGTYQKQKPSVSYSNGVATGHGAQILPGTSHGHMIQYTDVDEHRWRPDEFTKMEDLEMIYVLQNSGSTRYIKAKMTPEP